MVFSSELISSKSCLKTGFEHHNQSIMKEKTKRNKTHGFVVVPNNRLPCYICRWKLTEVVKYVTIYEYPVTNELLILNHLKAMNDWMGRIMTFNFILYVMLSFYKSYKIKPVKCQSGLWHWRLNRFDKEQIFG